MLADDELVTSNMSPASSASYASSFVTSCTISSTMRRQTAVRAVRSTYIYRERGGEMEGGGGREREREREREKRRREGGREEGGEKERQIDTQTLVRQTDRQTDRQTQTDK